MADTKGGPCFRDLRDGDASHPVPDRKFRRVSAVSLVVLLALVRDMEVALVEGS